MDYTGIVFLLLGASAMSLLQITLRFSQNKGKNVMASIAANYFVAALVCAATIATSGGLSISPFTVYFGIIMGIMFMVGIVIITISFGQKGVALTSSVSQLAVLSRSVAGGQNHNQTRQKLHSCLPYLRELRRRKHTIPGRFPPPAQSGH